MRLDRSTILAGVGLAFLFLLVLARVTLPLNHEAPPTRAGQATPSPALIAAPPPPKPAAPEIVLPPLVEEVLRSGVLVVISKSSQQMYVFKDGVHWRSSPVSTGRRGHATPSGVFPILQKQLFHRSNLYSGAPMPFMQRLTWSGIAIHAGRLPGFPASHGCIRVPREFAHALYGLTKFGETTVVIANEPIKSEKHAQALALAAPPPEPAFPFRALERQTVELASAALPYWMPSGNRPAPVTPVAPAFAQTDTSHGQTIQLAAAETSEQAEARWAQLLSAKPELARFEKSVIPAMVGSRQVYRLRISAGDAHAYCAALQREGIACFNVS